jgi:hypothetical protein
MKNGKSHEKKENKLGVVNSLVNNAKKKAGTKKESSKEDYKKGWK